MPEDKFIQLARRLLEQTRTRAIAWATTESDGVFQVAFAEFSVRIWSAVGDGYDAGPTIELAIYNQNGELVDRVNDDGLKASGWDEAWSAMQELFESARRIAMGVDKALDAILEALEPTTVDEDPPF